MTRPRTSSQRMSSQRTSSQRMSAVLTAAVGVLVVGALGACGSSGSTTGSGGASTALATTSSTPTPATVTLTTTVTSTATTRKPRIDPSPTTPPPAKDAPAIPRSAQDYSTAFVKAWVDGDRTRATQLGTEAAVKAAFASRVDTMPHFVNCEGAAGSSYCTWQGDEYTMEIRLRNDLAGTGQPHAVIEVAFAH
ncbi:hypothetical protein ABEG17_07010 [Pedococcus sp. KACC 23699]|uniref:Lipoprotein n=1 Tax=Pedococcus sp. KACC 23699 TaxID=3149228 RepID=A0AAU7JYB7_9MICO